VIVILPSPDWTPADVVPLVTPPVYDEPPPPPPPPPPQPQGTQLPLQ